MLDVEDFHDSVPIWLFHVVYTFIMISFREWIKLKEMRRKVIEPSSPEAIPITAVPTYGVDDLPPTANNQRKIKRRNMKKK